MLHYRVYYKGKLIGERKGFRICRYAVIAKFYNKRNGAPIGNPFIWGMHKTYFLADKRMATLDRKHRQIFARDNRLLQLAIVPVVQVIQDDDGKLREITLLE